MRAHRYSGLISVINFSITSSFGFKFMNIFQQPVYNRAFSQLGMARISINDVLKDPQFPAKWPYIPDDFTRQDQAVDSNFYYQPRFVYHIDDYAVLALTQYYAKTIKQNSDILDICSSWVSHYPKDAKYGKVVGLGMNDEELAANKQLTNYVVQDLNKDPAFPFEDNSFDYVTCVVSVDYLIRPLEVFSEIRRVLRPGGTCIISQSNRCFPTKAISIWLNTNDLQHVYIIGSYFHYAGGFKPPISVDISPYPGRSDPMFIIQGEKA